MLKGDVSPLLRRARALASLTVAALLLMGLFAGVAHAANPVSGLTVDPLTPSAASGARTDYVIHFSTSATGALAAGQHITITLPTGSSTGTIVNAVITDVTTSTAVGSCGVSSQTVEVCTISSGKSVAAGNNVTVELDGVTNPPGNPTGAQQSLTVVTDTDTAAATASYSVGSAGSISTPSVDNSSPSTAAGARTDYVITFSTSEIGGMSGTAHSQITITFPGTATSPFNTGTIVNAVVTDTTTSTVVGSCGVSSQTVEVCTISSGKTVAAGDTLTVELDGVTTESPAPEKEADLLTVSTTSDTTATTSDAYPVDSPSTITTPSVNNSSPSTAAGARTDYLITFTTGAETGGLSGTAHSQITVTFPGTATSPFNTGTIVNAVVTDTTTSTVVGSCGVSSQTVEVCTISSGKTVADGDTLTVELDGVTTESPAPTKMADLLTVSTTSDVDTITSDPYPVSDGGSITAPRVDNTSPSTAAGARTDYVMTFTTSGTGGLSGTAHSQITVTFPGTATSPFNTGTIVNAVVTDTTTSTVVGSCGVSSQTVEVCTISSGKTVAAGDVLKVELDGVTTESPAPSGNLHTLTVSTTSDPTTMTSVTFGVANSSAITTPTVQLSSFTPSAPANYTITFNTSGTGGMSGTAHSQIPITLPTGSSTASITNAVVTDAGIQVGTCGVSSQTVEVCTISSGKSVSPGDQVIVSLTGVTNPSNVSTSSTLTVQTTSDVIAQTSDAYQGPPIVTAISPSSGPTSGGTGVTITGMDFTGATSVHFGTIAATSVTVVDASHITATSPAGTGAVDVTVIAPGGTSGTSAADQFTYVVAPAVTGLNPTAGPTAGATSVTITGTAFTNATAVKFGATNATSFTVNSATSITATAPSHTAATVDVTVTTAGGTSATGTADHYTYAAVPTVTSVSPTAGPTAGGTTVTITGTAFTNATAVKFGATNATSFTVNSATSVTATAPAEAAATVDITVTTAGGTSPANPTDQYAYLGVPTVTSVSPTSGPAGGGNTVTITGTNLTGATAVNFGTAAAAITTDSATSITATAPAETAATVDVTVTTPGGTSATSTVDRYTYKAPTSSAPAPAATPATAAPPVVSGGSPTTKTSNGATASGDVNPENQATTAFFEYGLDPSYRGPGADTALYDQSTPPQPVGSDATSHSIVASLTGLVPGALYHIRLVATNGAGTSYGPDLTFTTPAAPSPPPPALGQSQDAQPVSGAVYIKLPSGQFVLLTGNEQIPNGAEIDALGGSLKITTATAKKGKTQQGVFGGAVFTLTQARAGATKGLVTLSLVEGAFKGAPSYASCKAHQATDATIASTKTLQLLHASAHGKFRTKGKYSAATVLGTIWSVADRCDGTLTRDVTDSVSVNDFVRHKTIVLHAGQSYLAKAPGKHP